MRVVFVDIPRISAQEDPIAQALQRQLQMFENATLLAKLPQLAKERAIATYSEGVLQLATIIRERGHEVVVVNTDMLHLPRTRDQAAAELMATILAHDSAVAAFSCKTPAYSLVTDVCRRLRAAAPHVRVILGGPHPTACDTDCLSDIPDAIVVRHEADEVLPALLDRLQAGQTISGLPAVTFRNGEELARSRVSEKLIDLARIPPINYSLLPGDAALYHPYISTTRGCPRACAFCANAFLWQGHVRSLPLATARRNLESWLAMLQGPRTLHIADAFINMSDAHCEHVADLASLAQGRLVMSADIAPERLSDRQLAAIQHSPIRILCLGIETITESVRTRIRKRGNVSDVRRTLRQIRAALPECFVKAYWILGLPGEDKTTLRANQVAIQELLEAKLIDMVNAKPFVPLPGSEIFSNPSRYDVQLRCADWDRYARETPVPAYDTPLLAAEEIREAWLATMHDCLEFYSSVFGDTPPDHHNDDSWTARRVL